MTPYKKQLVTVLARIQNCWTHDDDGSDLIQSRISHLFSLIFNDLKDSIIGRDSAMDLAFPSFKKDEEEEIKHLMEKDYSFKKVVKEVEDSPNETTEQLRRKVVKLESEIENWWKPWKRDAVEYSKLLEEKNICSYCGNQNEPCDCPFG